MKKVVDAKALREKIEGLYKGKDLSNDDDKRLLKNERASLQYQDPEFRAEWEAKDKEARARKEANPEFREARVQRGKKIVKDLKRNQKIAKTVSKQYEDPEFREFKSNVIKDAFKNPEKLGNLHNGIKIREENGWYEKRGKAYKRIQTPYGEFESKKAAVEAMTKAGVANASGKLSVWLNTKKDLYYYIQK